MKERDVITLDEGLDYLIVKEFEFENETYYLAMGIDEENRSAEFSFITDRDGLTEKIFLPAPPKSSSLAPEQTKLPYAQYTLEISADGYYPKIINNLVIFSETQTFQPVNMIPLAVYERGVDFPKSTLSTTIEENPFLQ